MLFKCLKSALLVIINLWSVSWTGCVSHEDHHPAQKGQKSVLKKLKQGRIWGGRGEVRVPTSPGMTLHLSWNFQRLP